MKPSSEDNISSRQDSERNSAPVISVKKEDPEEERVDAAIAIFDDVDGDTTDEESGLVDANYVGFIEHNSINCWVCPGFRIPQIPQVSVVKRPLKDLCDAIKSGDIILDPDYQRDVVWDDTRCEGLLVSLLMGYLPPPIIFNVKLQIIETAQGKLKKYVRTCVDGKQRLTSILRFMRGEIGFLDSKHKKWYYQTPASNSKRANSTLSLLPEDMKKFFMSRFFICYEYNELSQSTEEEMFQLVQRGIALTPAEKMRAMSTEWAIFARKYEDDYSLILNLSKQGRASGFRLTLTIFAMVQEIMSSRRKGTLVPTLQASPQALTRMLEEKEPINPALKLKLKTVFDRYEELVKLSSTRITTTRYRVNADSAFDPAPSFLRGDGFDHVRTFSPLELITSALLVCHHMAVRTDSQLLDDVKEMRRHLRVKHKDLRVNAQCWTTAWEFIVRIKTLHNAYRKEEAVVKSEMTSSKHSASVPALPEARKKSEGSVICNPPRETAASHTEAEREPSGNKLLNSAINKHSSTGSVSILGQSGAGLNVNGNSKGAGQAKPGDNDVSDTGSDNMDDNASTTLRRSGRSSVLAHSEAVATTISRVTTGHNKSPSAINGMSKRRMALRVDTKSHKIRDVSDSGDSLSSEPSSALDSPLPQEFPVHSRKRGLNDGNNGMQAVREAKKSKH